MNFHEYRQSRRRTMSGDLTEKEEITNATFGLCGEAGEIADLIKKMFFHGREPADTRDKLLYEFGDLLFYLDWLSDKAGFTLEEIAIANKVKLEKRFPNGWNAEDAAKKMDESLGPEGPHGYGPGPESYHLGLDYSHATYDI